MNKKLVFIALPISILFFLLVSFIIFWVMSMILTPKSIEYPHCAFFEPYDFQCIAWKWGESGTNSTELSLIIRYSLNVSNVSIKAGDCLLEETGRTYDKGFEWIGNCTPKPEVEIWGGNKATKLIVIYYDVEIQRYGQNEGFIYSSLLDKKR